MKQILLTLTTFLFLGCATNSNVKYTNDVAAKEKGATWDVENAQIVNHKGATWNTSDGPTYYLYSSYYQEGAWVEIPAKIGGAIGVIPGTAVGVVIGLPALPWHDYETTILGSQIFFGKGVSLLVGLPFYVTKIILYDVPKSVFTE